MCILKGYAGPLTTKAFDSVENYLKNGAELNEEAREMEKDFDKKFRLLVSDK